MNNKKILFALGRPFSPFYELLMRFRETCYLRGTFKATRFEVPVVSVGNLTLGGTGKTPMVQYLARLLQSHGYQPAVISRGYGGATKKLVNVVSDGNSVLLDAAGVGDEPRLLAETLPGVPVLTGVVRKLPAARAVAMGANVLLLDDGFQHMAVARDVDLVLFQADMLAGNSRVFPGGDLREPVKALNRCSCFLLTSVNEHNKQRCGKFADLLKSRFPDKPIHFLKFTPVSMVQRTGEGRIREVERFPLQGKKYFAFCGIGHPESFRMTLQQQKITLVDFHALPDHHGYSQDIQKLTRQAMEKGADMMITTEKDLVKLDNMKPDLPLVALRMQVEATLEFDRFIVENVDKFTLQKRNR